MKKTVTQLILIGIVGWLSPAFAAPQGDASHGQELYAECSGCHALQENQVGPKHCGLIGRRAGSVKEYSYSEAMRASGITWDEKRLNAFLISPFTYVNGTNMGYAGLDNESDRRDLIAYIKKITADPVACGQAAR